MRAAALLPAALSAAAPAAACVRPGTCVPPAAKERSVLPVTPRRQWEISGGFCGALSIQTAALAHGAWISQDLVRKANTRGEGHGSWLRRTGYEVLPTNVAETASNLKLKYDEWDYNLPKPHAPRYKAWLKRHLARKHAVVWFVMTKGDGKMVPYKGSNPNGGRFSHIEPVWGLYSNRSLDDPEVYDDDVLVHGSDQDLLPYYRTFGSLVDSPAMDGNCAGAIGIPGRNEMYPCIYDQVNYGLAVTGLAGEALTVRLAVDRATEPDVRLPLTRPAALRGNVTVTGLAPGAEYVVWRYNSTAAFPTRPEAEHRFTAAGAEYVYADPAPFPSDGATYYRAAAAPAPAPAAPPAPAPAQRKRLAVLGSGLGSMAAVYYLTNVAGWEDEWEIDVYQVGWRLGGKGASARTMSDAKGARVLEHGLHIFFAGYSNAYKWLTDMYKEWEQPKDAAIKSLNDAFKASCNSDLWIHLQGGAPEWQLINQKDPAHHAWQCLYDFKPWGQAGRGAPTPWALLSAIVRGLNATYRRSGGEYPGAAAELAAAHGACAGPPAAAAPERARLLAALRALRAFAARDLTAAPAGGGLGRIYPPPGWCNAANATCTTFIYRATIMEVSLAVGLIEDDVLLKGFGSIAGEKFDNWLCRHGDCLGVDNAGGKDDMIRALYSAIFAFKGRNPVPDMSALGFVGSGIYDTYGDQPFPVAQGFATLWRMQAGMGELIMSPAYEILRKRGVRFHFFHKVEQLRSADGTAVDEIDVTVQATVKKGGTEYEPTFRTKGVTAWPDLSNPSNCDGCARFFDQLEEGGEVVRRNVNLESFFSGWEGAGRKTLRRGADFDVVLNGMTSGTLPHVSQDLRAKSGEWAAFVDTTETVATAAMQIWTYNTTQELGYVLPEMPADKMSRWELMSSSGPEPYDTIADMSHLLKVETCNATAMGGEARSVVYFCSPIAFDTRDLNFSDTSVPAVQTERAFQEGAAWLEKYVGTVYPKWAGRVYESMVAPPGVVGRDRLRYQYYRVNFEPPEQYVLSAPGSMRYRPTPYPFRPGHTRLPFLNMALAGDHTDNGINVGCAEAAVSSGFMAAYGLSGNRTPDLWTDYEASMHSLGELDDPHRLPVIRARGA